MPDLGGVEVFARGCAPDWDQSYVTQLHHREDLVLAHALRQADPVALSEIYRSNGATETQRGVLGGYRESGFGNGLAVPVFGPGGRNGCVILGFGNSRRAASGDAAPEASQVASLQVACQAAHLRHCKLRREMRPPPPSLSNRERELLMWVAQGKSNGVIAEIMQISPHTVDAYMRRVFLKLGAADRVSAVLRSVAETLIVGH